MDQIAAAEANLANVRALARRFAQEVREHLGRRVRSIRLFGSAARGDWMPGSDVDVLVLLDDRSGPETAWLVQRAFEIGVLEHEIILQPVIMAERDYVRLKDRERLFAMDVEREGIDL